MFGFVSGFRSAARTVASSPRFAAGISSLGFASAGEVEDDEEDEDKDEDEDEDEEREEEERVEVEDEEGAAAVEEPCASRRRLDGRSDAIQMFGWASGLKVKLQRLRKLRSWMAQIRDLLPLSYEPDPLSRLA